MQKNRTSTVLIMILLAGVFLGSCNREDSRIEEERVLLEQYLKDSGYTNVEPTSSGLYHVVKQEGTGDYPDKTDFINIEFEARLIDGTLFETSDRSLAALYNIERDDKLYGPAKFKLEFLGIQGLREGIMLMKEGASSRIIIPSNLGFGSADLGTVPPYSTLIYDVDLLDVISDPVEHEKNLLDEYLIDNEIDESPVNGIYYIEEERGEGNLPGDDKDVTLQYTGYLLDGRVFDQSTPTNPLVVNISAANIIPGFIEGIRLMRKGGKATIIVPWDLGYGAEGSAEGIIPPYSTLVFDIEILDIN